MRLAYLILAHHNPAQLERLVKRLVYTNSDVYIHVDLKIDINQFAALRTVENVFFIQDRVSIIWGDYSMIEAELRSFSEILASGKTYSHINLLSGQDYPLKHAAEIERFLFANEGKSFMKYKSIEDEWPESLSRIQLYSLGDYHFPLKYRLQGLLNKLFHPRKLPLNMKPYGFSQWITITPEAVNFVNEYLKAHPNVKRFFRMTWGVDELFFQTILVNSSLKNKVVNDHLRYIKFIPKAPRPNTLTMNDAEALTASGKLFARKFDPEKDTAILDHLDQAASFSSAVQP